PGAYLAATVAKAFPNGLVVPRPGAGPGNDIVLSSAAEVQAFLKSTTKNPFSNATVKGYVATNLEAQFVSLSLSVGFDAYEKYGANELLLGNLVLFGLKAPESVANGLTVSGFLAQVAAYLDGSSSYTLGLAVDDLISVMSNVTRTFDVGGAGGWAGSHLR